MRVSKQLDPVMNYAKDHGWELRRRTSRNTLVFGKEGCGNVTVSMWPKDWRAAENMLAKMRGEDRALAAKTSNTNP